MVKIEKLLHGCKASILRDEVRQPLFVGQLITQSDLDTLEVVFGTLVYTIDEQEIVEVNGTEPTNTPVATEPPVKVAPPTKPKVVQPKK